ncbi:MAG: type I 3-dehydroquinate dehydratase [Clostridia bacterium]|nr:type I 3-dehydroquinate dehydratase [Clostridia bacterium]
MKKSFLGHDRPLLTAMLQAYTPERVEELAALCRKEGAEAFGMQFCRMKDEYKSRDTYKKLFSLAGDLPVYVTNYRQGENEGKSDDELAAGLLELAECGATLCDVMGDMFDKQDDEMAKDSAAIEKQIKLIDSLHAAGAEVIVSSHIFRFTPAERVMEIALEQKRRGADICKIVSGADSMEQQIENLRIVNMLKEKLGIPFLFLSAGECRILRRIGGEIGCCMYLCVHEYDELATPSQPLLRCAKAIRDNINI